MQIMVIIIIIEISLPSPDSVVCWQTQDAVLCSQKAQLSGRVFSSSLRELRVPLISGARAQSHPWWLGVGTIENIGHRTKTSGGLRSRRSQLSWTSQSGREVHSTDDFDVTTIKYIIPISPRRNEVRGARSLSAASLARPLRGRSIL